MDSPKRFQKSVVALLALVTPGAVAAVDPILIYDNGDHDGQNGYSNGTEGIFGARRSLLDDFVVPGGERWIVSGMRWISVWSGCELVGTGAQIALWTDAEGSPEALLETLNVTSYSEVFTGRIAFSFEEVASWVTFDPVLLEPGHYWFEANAIGLRGNFWLTAPQRNAECWVNYRDDNGLESGTEQFGLPSDLSWGLFGETKGFGPGACCLSDGQCLEILLDDCAARGGAFLGHATHCLLETCGLPGACCRPDGICVVQTEPQCEADLGVFAGESVPCLGLECCVGDLDGSGAVDFGDIVLVLAAWGTTGDPPEDLDGSGVVDFGDLLVVLARWGPCA